MVVTTLFKDDIAPRIRFNTHDITHELTGVNQTGMVFKRIAGFKGRSDNMVKLRGINVYPHAIWRADRKSLGSHGGICFPRDARWCDWSR